MKRPQIAGVVKGRRRFVRWVLFGVGLVVLVCAYDLSPWSSRARARKAPAETEPASFQPTSIVMHIPGGGPPVTVRAADAACPPETEVVGVCVGGRARAYVLAALAPVFRHVLNDVLSDGTPVSVTYCDRTQCVRAFTGDTRGRPLELGVGGWHEEQLLLSVGGVFYLQKSVVPVLRAAGEIDPNEAQVIRVQAGGYAPKSGETAILDEQRQPFPYQTLPCERTSWESWKRAHPETDVYLGT